MSSTASAEIRSSTNVYNSAGQVTSQTDPAGAVTSFDYTSVPGSTLVTDPTGAPNALPVHVWTAGVGDCGLRHAASGDDPIHV